MAEFIQQAEDYLAKLEAQIYELEEQTREKDAAIRRLSMRATTTHGGLPTVSDFQRELTYIMVKPDGVQRGLVGEIVERFEQKGFKLVALKMETPTRRLLENHYSDLSSKPFFGGLIEYMLMGPVVCMVWEGDGVVKAGRVMLGATKPSDSCPGSIRGDMCIDVGRNIIHGSDAVDSAIKEIELWFPEGLNFYAHHSEKFIYEEVKDEQ